MYFVSSHAVSTLTDTHLRSISPAICTMEFLINLPNRYLSQHVAHQLPFSLQRLTCRCFLAAEDALVYWTVHGCRMHLCTSAAMTHHHNVSSCSMTLCHVPALHAVVLNRVTTFIWLSSHEAWWQVSAGNAANQHLCNTVDF